MGDEAPNPPYPRYNPWGYWKPLRTTAQTTARRNRQVDSRFDLQQGLGSTDAIAVHEYIDCTEFTGIEFVVRGAFIDSAPWRLLPGNVVIFGCAPATQARLELLPDSSPPHTQDSHYFLYDGWLELPNREATSILGGLETIELALAQLRFVLNVAITWAPKYRDSIVHWAHKPTISVLTDNTLRDLDHLHRTHAALPDATQRALRTAMASLGHASAAPHPIDKLLHAYTALEGLCAFLYSEHTLNNLPLTAADQELSRSQRKEARDAKIVAFMNKELKTDPTKAVQNAYFQLIVGIKNRILAVFAAAHGSTQRSSILFEPIEDGLPSPNDLRNQIAHGALSRLEAHRIPRLLEVSSAIANEAKFLALRILERAWHPTSPAGYHGNIYQTTPKDSYVWPDGLHPLASLDAYRISPELLLSKGYLL